MTIENVKDTTNLQLASLDVYMRELGFKRSTYGLRYEFIYPAKSGTKTVSFATACFLHNTEWDYDAKDNVYYPVTVSVHRSLREDTPFALAPYEYEKSQSYKIVKSIKLQADKHGRLITQNHIVSFPNKFYFEQFLGDS